MSLPMLESTQKLRAALQAKAKGQSSFRFDSLYDKVSRKDVLWDAWCRCRHNGGAPGVDGQTFADIEQSGVEEWSNGLAEELRTKTYQPQAVRRPPQQKDPHPESRWEAAAAGHPDDQRPSHPDCGADCAGADFRGRLATRAVRLPGRTQRTRCGAGGPRVAVPGPYGGGGRGPQR